MGQDTETRRLRGFGDTNIVLLDQRGGAESSAPLAEALFSLEVQGEVEHRWRVERFEAIEELSTLYECVIDLASEAITDNPEAMLGHYARLLVRRESVSRRFVGLVRRVEQRGTTGTDRLARIHIVPALWTLSQRSDSRIFQDMTAVQVVQAVLHEAELYEGALDPKLLREYPKREYCVQYRETDLAFVLRLLESEGIAFFFRHDEEGETLVLADGVHAWEPVRTMGDGAIPIAGAEGSTHQHETIRNLTWEREQRPTSVAVRDFDFTRPGFKVERMVPKRLEGQKRDLYEPAPALTLGGYANTAYTADDAQEQAQLRHEAEQVSGAMGRGEGRVIGMMPGGSFALTLAGTHLSSQRYLVLRVEHVGDAQEELVLASEREALGEDRYHNRFQCILTDTPFRPARATSRPVIAGLQTATVTGPRDEEIYTDEHGRIKVQFHWDRRGARDEHTTCWLRAMQGPWSGNGWGFQFLPRVGMEVAVSFVEGDPDRPVILGALYNGEHGAPFALPGERSRSGIRTQSVGGDGHNELSFEDQGGVEEVYLHAQRDLREVVRHDHVVEVGHDEREVVLGKRAASVGQSDTRTVLGDSEEHVHGDRRRRVEHNDRVTVVENADRLVLQDDHVRVEGRFRSEVIKGSEAFVRDDSTVRVHGHQAMIVGRYEAKRSAALHVEGTATSWSSLATEITSDKDIVLRCGASMIRLTPKRVEIISPEVIVRGGENRITVTGEKVRVRAKSDVVIGAEKVTVKSRGAAVKLDAEAKVMGAKVNLGAGSIPLDSDPNDPVRLTSIELTDDQGAPMPHQRFVVLMDDGSEQTGFLNHEGKAVVELEGMAKVVFPELSGIEEA